MTMSMTWAWNTKEHKGTQRDRRGHKGTTFFSFFLQRQAGDGDENFERAGERGCGLVKASRKPNEFEKIKADQDQAKIMHDGQGIWRDCMMAVAA